MRACLTIVALLSLIACGDQDRVRLGAASSLSEVLPRVFEGVDIEVVYGGSGELAAQLRHGAPFDALLLADPVPLARTAAAGLTSPPTGAFGNELVLAARPSVTPGDPDAVIRQAGCLALGAPGVPAGDYARRWLATRELGDVRLIELPHVRAVAAAVESDACAVGAVYATDLRGRDLHPVARWAPEQEVGPVYAWAIRLESPRAEAARQLLTTAMTRHDLFSAHGFRAALVQR